MTNNSVPETLAFGLTLSQMEELQLQARIATSVLDIFTTDGGEDISPESVRTIGGIAFQATHAVRDTLDATSNQRLDQNYEHVAHGGAPALYAAPSWDTAPEWANFLAMDADGQWHWYESRPYQDTNVAGKQYGMWDIEGGRHQVAIAALGWDDSLQEKPAVQRMLPPLSKAAA